jgi:hypothetical protein
MIAKIISTSKGVVVIDEVIYTIPELSALWEKTQDTKPFQYLWCLYDPYSPYMNLTENEREDMVKKDHFNESCIVEEFFLAKRKCQELYNTPRRKILNGAKSVVEKLADYFQNCTVEGGRDGNISAIKATLVDLPKIMKGSEEAQET